LVLTANCDLFASIDEEGIKLIANHIMHQRPSIFNYGTESVVESIGTDNELNCQAIVAAPAVIQRNNPLMKVVDPLPIWGSAFGLNYCFQITEANIDLHPGDKIDLPPQLNPPLKEQRFSLNCKICGGLGCPSPAVLKNPSNDVKVLPADKLKCFCLELFIIGHFERRGVIGNERVEPKLDDLEIMNISPGALEDNMECYLRALIQLVILPRLSFLTVRIIPLNVLNLPNIILSLTPAPSSNVPNNPAIENNQIKVLINVNPL
jgi:hypothetical protein